MTHRCLFVLLVFVLVVCVLLTAIPVRAGTSISAHCPGYVAALRMARGHLERGDREAAVAAVRAAREALAACVRDRAEEAALALLTKGAAPRC